MNILSTLLSMMLFALATSATPGPVNIISAMTGARYGVQRSLLYVFGATISFVVILICVGVGVGYVVNIVDKYSLILLLLGSSYMLYLAYKIAVASEEINLNNSKDKSCLGFLAGFLTQTSNPKAWFVSLSAIFIYVTPYSNRFFYLGIFSLIFLIICSLSLTLWAYIGQHVAKVSGNFRIINKVMSMLLVISVVLIVYEHLQLTI